MDCISSATKEEPVMAECLWSILLGRLNPSLAPALRSPISQTNVYHRYIVAAPRKNPPHSHQACTTYADIQAPAYCIPRRQLPRGKVVHPRRKLQRPPQCDELPQRHKSTLSGAKQAYFHRAASQNGCCNCAYALMGCGRPGI